MTAESESDVPELEGIDEKNPSKSELKARKAMAKLGLKPVTEIKRVVIRRANNSLFVIAEADVYKTLNGDTHIIFGKAQIEDALSQQEAAQRVMGGDIQPRVVPETEAPSADAAPEEDDDDEVDEEGIESNDIEMVMAQANVSRSKAVKALRSNNLDLVNAIMELNIE